MTYLQAVLPHPPPPISAPPVPSSIGIKSTQISSVSLPPSPSPSSAPPPFPTSTSSTSRKTDAPTTTREPHATLDASKGLVTDIKLKKGKRAPVSLADLCIRMSSAKPKHRSNVPEKVIVGRLPPIRKLSTKDKKGMPADHLSLRTQTRGKEREIPRKKILSKMKKVILQEREHKYLEWLSTHSSSGSPIRDPSVEMKKERVEQKLATVLDSLASIEAKDALMDEISSTPIVVFEQEEEIGTDEDNDHDDNDDDICSTQPTPTEGYVQFEDETKQVDTPLSSTPLPKGYPKIPSGHIPREYVDQVLSSELNDVAHNLLVEYVRLQNKMVVRNPLKAATNKRYYMGLREVTKAVNLGKLTCVIIAPNLDEVASEGGLDEAVQQLVTTCRAMRIPFAFALNRRKLGKALGLNMRISVAGLASHSGVDELFTDFIKMVSRSRDMYKLLRKEGRLNMALPQ
eukprot:TRINITY_DN4348_c0_g1_i5.p1 TRINITY_DN4348_c0_g1~~TRINITY_DN4348_c0_g1_i5.p1  ORF type:complete len:511 (-),score=41.80 TRINITY_DN4348_c0_g1_i5:4-1374(-)